MTRSQQVTTAGTVLRGTPAVPGVAAAPAVRPNPRLPVDARTDIVPESERAAELTALRAAAATVADRLRTRAEAASGAAAEVLAANAAMAADRGWSAAAEKLIGTGSTASAAAIGATEQFAQMFSRLGGLMAERVTDLRDVCDRIVAELHGLPEPGVPTPERPSILLARDLAPADTAGLDPARIIGLATALGGATSHTAIIARQLGIPCVVAVDGLDDVPAGAQILIDGAAGTVTVEPAPAVAAAAVAAHRATAARIASWTGPGATRDGHRVDILANVQDGAGARAATATPAEGIGLFRTELCFLDRDAEPSVAEQTRIYREVLDAYPTAKVVIRTLDAGSDKPLRFAEHPDEANPALGVRGIRIAARDSGILERQLDAIAAAADGRATPPWVMAPMVATVAEARSFAAAARARGLVAGVMIEVPAAALLAEAILDEVDFVSIGTNDLAQYTMAADRMSPDLAALTDPWQPAVLSLVARTAAAGVRCGKPVGVCGEAAADPLLACVLAGLGVTSLSAAAPAVAGVGAQLATVTRAQCESAAWAVLRTTDPGEARVQARRLLLDD
ncbi:phosphoenolpyruvate--protein phosphotransferase [Nocardia farcinica]|uniref:putative PEP-binding protein n=1 Tax=Nocardia TaxID=1817 RepID=UPI000BF0BB34|nr:MULTISPECIES: putative PEP-binding protein [Nocardia]MBF6070767.1 phosphoenolpyruvate--protein phosphotransferase [Nocardia farcinica]MBF6184105.1 phosphoenolpyruvate--protein phosphotransferase [Nocardia farcinica]MBF6293049.1 phosphoenolpyruvate--protein phosphotransferase [Nocardia farcinica]MBF6309948.1 phosphoenolpyruvate--protein phosphotransferase [Nocardia farcinica]MBF6379344.1 phosphoenolpyruvate--protein phosphotransferase [Nocardia farcinica]